jgi:hypothetical protein
MMVFHDVMACIFYEEMVSDDMCEHVVPYYLEYHDENDVVFS